MKGLTRETFSTSQHTSSAVPDLVKYLLAKPGISYILTVNLQSDFIEIRFGRYRRSVGTNYFISVRQVLEAEKAVRIMALVSENGLNPTEVNEIFEKVTADRKAATIESASLLVEYWHWKNCDFFLKYPETGV